MYEERVSRGAALFDQVNPDWFHMIDRDLLAMESCDNCILGQVYGHYEDGFRSLIADLPDTILFSAADHGFTLYNAEQESIDVFSRFAALADAWRAEIRRRLESAALVSLPESVSWIPDSTHIHDTPQDSWMNRPSLF